MLPICAKIALRNFLGGVYGNLSQTLAQGRIIKPGKQLIGISVKVQPPRLLR